MGPRGFKRTFDTYRDPVYRFLLRLCRAPSEAEDLLQDTFLAFWRRSGPGPDDDHVLPYLRRIAFRLYLNQRTKSTRRTALAPGFEHLRPREDSGDIVTTRDEERYLLDLVRATLDDLPDDQREVFVLHRFEGLTCREIAALMDVPLKTTESRVRRATRAIADRIRSRTPGLETG